MRWVVLTVWVVLAAGGCSGSARVELAAADALDALAGELNVALGEYQSDLDEADTAREAAVVNAFIERVRRDNEDEAQVQAHSDAFQQALAHLRSDRRAAWERLNTARDNVAVTQEVARDLRRVALTGLALQADAKRYIETLIDAQKTMSEEQAQSEPSP